MPVFEYRCGDCGTKYDHYHKSLSNQEEVKCPECGSSNNKKLFSSFAPSVEASADFGGGCADGSCGLPTGGCASGMCGLD